MLNEFFLYVLADLHTCQGLSSLQFTSGEAQFVKATAERVYPAIPATPTAAALPEIRAFSMQLVAYLAAFLPVAPYFRANDPRITGVCDDQYTSTLESLETSTDERFKDYFTRKTQGWFGRWGRNVAAPAPDASPAPGAAPGGAGVPPALPRRRRVSRRRRCRMAKMTGTALMGRV